VIVSTPTSNASNKKPSFIKRTTAAVQNKSRSIFLNGSTRKASQKIVATSVKRMKPGTPNSAKIVRMQQQIDLLTTANEEQTEILQDVAQKFEVIILQSFQILYFSMKFRLWIWFSKNSRFSISFKV
jgi:hypothetical protein